MMPSASHPSFPDATNTHNEQDLLLSVMQSNLDSIQKEAQFYQTLLTSPVYVLGEKRGNEYFFQRWQRQEDGTEVIPFFSNLTILQGSIHEPTSYIKMSGKSFIQHCGNFDAILNPLETTARLIPVNELGMLKLRGVASVVIQPNAKEMQSGAVPLHILAALPKAIPLAVIDAITQLLSPHDDIRTAFILQVLQTPSAFDVQPNLIIALEIEKTKHQAIRLSKNFPEKLEAKLKPLLGSSFHFTVVWLNQEQPLSDFMVKHTFPIYEKGGFGKSICFLRNRIYFDLL